MLKKILLQSRYLTILIVVITTLCALVLYLLTSVSAVLSIYEAISSGQYTTDSTKILAIKLLKIVDLFLICIGLQIIAAGIYKLFINQNIDLPAPMNISSFSELKQSMVRISTLVLLILFVERAVEMGPGRELLEYGLAISAILVSASWATKNLLDTKKHLSLSKKTPKDD